jgi:hypothetical protein
VTISALYAEQYQDIKSGRVVVLNDENEVQQILTNLEKQSKDTSHDHIIADKLAQFLKLENEVLIEYFQKEIEQVLTEIEYSNKQDEIQALFIEYHYYYHFRGGITCYGQQNYPVIEEPRYILGEFNHTKQIIFLDKSINFEPAWLDCQELENFDSLEVVSELENLFQIHSRSLLHKALVKLDNNNKLHLFKNRPFTFYINEHDCEVMMLYRLS